MAVIIAYIVQVLYWAIILRLVLSWFPNLGPNNPLVRIVYNITEPILAPIRRIVPRTGMFDLTPMVAIILLFIVQLVVSSAF